MLVKRAHFVQALFPHLWITIDNRIITDYLIGLFNKA